VPHTQADYQWTRLFSHMAIALITSLTFLQLNDSARSLQYRVFAIFIVTVLPALVLAQIEPQYIMSRNTYVREASSKMYSATVSGTCSGTSRAATDSYLFCQVFALCQMLAEMPYSVLCAVGFYLLWYFPIGFVSNCQDEGVSFCDAES
jgi:ABC-type multidrug transport system permease subunit